MDFRERLSKAIERGRRTGDARAAAAARREMSEKELTRLHSQYRLELSDHIEQCVRSLADQFPGFRVETLFGEKGWGAAASRDDLKLRRGDRDSLFSRLEMLIRPPGEYPVLELIAKATIQNREMFNRSHYERLDEVDPASFRDRVDLWTLEYAELYAARQ
jgi:hypothetical protein